VSEAHPDDSAVFSSEGVSLFTTGPAVGASELSRELGNWTDVKQALRITLNKAALESRVIAVQLEGKTYRYVGRKDDTRDRERWDGRDADGSPLWVSCSQSNVIGQLGIGPRMFFIVGHVGEPLLVEIRWADA
jgi:hypothetical protein